MTQPDNDALAAARRVWPRRRRNAGATAEDIAVRGIAAEEAAERVPLPPPPDPNPIEEAPAPRFNLAAIRLAGLGLVLVLVLSISMVRLFVSGPPTVAELRAQAGVDQWTQLEIGVKADQPGTGFFDASTGIWSGFDIDIAYMIAEDLGFARSEVRFYSMESEDRARMQATTTDDAKRRVPVKLVIASYSVTADRKAMTGVTFSSPYLYTEQSVLTLAGHPPVSTLEDFKGRDVCTLSTSTSVVAPQQAQAVLHRKNQIGECVRELAEGKVDAVTTDAAILAGFMATSPGRYRHWDLGLDRTEAWGVNAGDNKALAKLVDLTLYHSLKDPADDRWETAYQRNFQTEVSKQGGTPIAVAQQPDVPKPDVREQPWERTSPMTDLYGKGGGLAPRRRRAQLNWLLTVLPAFPLILLVLRLWYLSRQDLPTMLLLVQYISPLGMISALFITLIWTVPAVILVLRVLGGILLISAPEQAGRSLLAVTALRMPDWVVLIAALLAAFTWQLRLLPTLVMLLVSIMGLIAVQRFPGERWLIVWSTLVVPVLAGVLVLIFVWPGITAAFAAGEGSTAVLLGAPPLVGPLLTGAVPQQFARLVTHWPAVGAALLAPLVVGVVFLRAPVLPNSAVEVAPANGTASVIRGQLIAVDDTSTTVLEPDGEVTFVDNDEVRSKTLCPQPDPPPDSAVSVRGWPVGSSALAWVAPVRNNGPADPRCLGREVKPR